MRRSSSRRSIARSAAFVPFLATVAAAAAFALVLRQIPAVPHIPDLMAFSFVVAIVMQQTPVVELPSALGTGLYLASVGLFASAVAVTTHGSGVPRATVVRLGTVAGIAASLIASVPSVDSVTVAFIVLPLAAAAALLVLSLAVAGATVGSRLLS